MRREQVYLISQIRSAPEFANSVLFVQTSLAAQAEQMGAIHRYDLTLDATHLIVGHHDTDKYKFVARGRPDVRPMTTKWIETVRELWMNDQEINMDELERIHTLPTLNGLRLSMTGCDDGKF